MLTRVLAIVALVVAGGIVALVGTGAHRSFDWWGVSLALLLIALAGTFAKVWQSWLGFVGYALGWVVMVTVLAVGLDGSVLIADDARGQAWVFGGALVMIVTAIVPTFLWLGRRGEA